MTRVIVRVAVVMDSRVRVADAMTDGVLAAVGVSERVADVVRVAPFDGVRDATTGGVVALVLAKEAVALLVGEAPDVTVGPGKKQESGQSPRVNSHRVPDVLSSPHTRLHASGDT